MPDNSTPIRRLSVLDVSPVLSGESAAAALHHTLGLARFVDGLGFHRYWLAEHHNTALIASSSPEVMIGHVASVTKHLRVGSGGIMLPNHTPLQVAEAFRTLEALHPGRIDLGIGRAPGTDTRTAVALRRSREAVGADDFPEQMGDLLTFFNGEFPEDHPFRRITAIPEGVSTPPIWLLGSSDFSAALAADLGLGFAFAHHINPEPVLDALRIYRERFQPAATLSEPQAFVAVSAICGETDERAELLARSADLTLLRFQQRRIGPLPSLQEATEYLYSPFERDQIRYNRARLFVGSPQTLKAKLSHFAEQAGVEELMVTTLIHDHADRCRSYQLLAEAFGLPPAAADSGC